MKKILMVVATAALVLVGCDNGGGGDEARIRLIQASNPGSLMGLLADGSLIESGTFGQASDYNDADEESQTLSGLVGDQTVFTTPVDLDNDVDYTVVTVPQGGSVTALVYTDDNSSPDVGNAKLRTIHAAPGIGPVDVYALREGESVTNHEPNFTALTYSRDTAYDQLDRNEYVVWVTQAGTKTVLASAESRDLKNLEIWSAVLYPSANGTGLTLGVFRDQEGDDPNF